MSLSDEQIATRKQQSAQMRAEQQKHKVSLAELSKRFRCTNQQAFNVLQGIDLDSELRDHIYNYFCGLPGQGLRQGHTSPAAPATAKPDAGGAPKSMPFAGHPAAPVAKKPEVVNLLVPSRKEREAAKLAAAAPQPVETPAPSVATAPASLNGWKPPQPDPVPPVEITEREDAPGALQTETHAPATMPPPETSPAVKPAPGHLSDPEVGARIRKVMETYGHNPKSLGLVMGHNSGSNVSASLGKSGSRSLQRRMCDMLGLDHQGFPDLTKKCKLPKKPEGVTVTPEESAQIHGPGKVASTVKAPESVASIKPLDQRISAQNRAVGIRIKREIEVMGYTPKLVAWHLGYSNPGLIGAVLKGYHHPELRKRILDVLSLNENGYRTPADNHQHKLPPASEIRPPAGKIDLDALPSDEKIQVVAEAMRKLGLCSTALKRASENYRREEAAYNEALAVVQRLGISPAALIATAHA